MVIPVHAGIQGKGAAYPADDSSGPSFCVSEGAPRPRIKYEYMLLRA